MSDFWAGKRCLVTGGVGFVGGHVCRALRAAGAAVHSFDRNNTAEERSEWPGDVTDAAAVRRVFSRVHPQIVFHLAARTEVGASFADPELTYRTNVLGTLNVLEACRVWKISAVVLASTDKAYGWRPPHELPFRETEPLRSSRDPYGNSKRLADELGHDYARTFGLPLRVLRPCNTYGPGQRNGTTLVTAAAQAVLRGGKPKVHRGQANALREWLYVEDAAGAYLLAAEDAWENHVHGYGPGGHSWNVGSGCVETVGRTAGFVLEALGCDSDGWEAVADPPGTPPAADQWVDSSAFRTRFPAWLPTPLGPGLAKTVDWYEERFEAGEFR